MIIISASNPKREAVRRAYALLLTNYVTKYAMVQQTLEWFGAYPEKQ